MKMKNLIITQLIFLSIHLEFSSVMASFMQISVLSSVPGLELMQKDQPMDISSVDGELLPRVCLALPSLTDKQRGLCEQLPETVEAVPYGTQQGLFECEYQFRNDRWNCTDNRDTARIQSTLERGSKETAFLYAITSAGVVHTLARACSSGNLTECNCDKRYMGQNTPEGWKWGGCSDNLRYGVKFARKFIDAPDKKLLHEKGEIRNLMNLHNNEAGRRAISKLMLMKCRCHGVSGSCEFKTCWRSLPKFAEIGKYLKSKYDRSAVKVSDKFKYPKLDRYRRGAKKMPDKLPVNKKSLVYIQKSPDYCQDDAKAGVIGTAGRKCNAKSKGRDGCNFLCCGRGYRTEVVVEYEKCKCKFVWCCKVICRQCRRRKHYHTCN